MDGDRALEAAGDRRVVERRKPADAGRRQVAGDAAHAEAVAPVGRDGDVDQRIVEAHQRRDGRTDWRVVGQLDDRVVLVRKTQFAFRQQHAVALDVADDRLLELEAGARDGQSRGGEDALHATPRVGRAAHHLDLAGAGVDPADRELVGVWVPRRLDHIADGEGGKRRARVGDILDLEAERGKAGDDFVERRLGLEMVLEPRKRELHRVSPPPSVGVSSAAKP